MMTDEELLRLVTEARRRGVYEDDPRWDAIDQGLRDRGFDMTETTDD